MRTDDAAVRMDAAEARDSSIDDTRAPDAHDAGSAIVDPSCTDPGCLRSVEALGDFRQSELEPLLEDVDIDNGYSVFVIEYVTTPQSGLTTSLATVTIPFPRSAPADGYGIVANAHGTVGLDDRCTLSGTVYGSGLSGLFGARGAIGVMPDYPGLGTPGTHPYLVADVEGAAVLDSLRAASNLAALDGTPVSGRVATVGLSQGGHASLAAAAQHARYAPELDLVAVAAAAPATLYLEHWSDGVRIDGEHQALHAMLVYAYAQHYGSVESLFSPELEPRIAGLAATHCTFDFSGAVPVLSDEVGTSAELIFAPEFLTAYRAGTLSAYPAIEQGFRVNRVVPFEQTAPIAIWQGDSDAVVPQVYTDEVVEDLRAGGMEVDYRVVPGGTHLNVAFGFVASAQLRTLESTEWVLRRLE